jgi:hypothetical protein
MRHQTLPVMQDFADQSVTWMTSITVPLRMCSRKGLMLA